jgi:hypothetical protein
MSAMLGRGRRFQGKTPRASPMKLLRQHAEHFELVPEAQPNQVKARGLALKAPAAA